MSGPVDQAREAANAQNEERAAWGIEVRRTKQRGAIELELKLRGADELRATLSAMALHADGAGKYAAPAAGYAPHHRGWPERPSVIAPLRAFAAARDQHEGR